MGAGEISEDDLDDFFLPDWRPSVRDGSGPRLIPRPRSPQFSFDREVEPPPVATGEGLVADDEELDAEPEAEPPGSTGGVWNRRAAT
jgi:hypothetical protein